jgi:porphobilinogen synthase
MPVRPRRLRGSENIRQLVGETRLDRSSLIQPYFVHGGAHAEEPIASFFGVARWSVDALSKRIERDLANGLSSFLLFAKAERKDATGSEAAQAQSVMARALRALKQRFGQEVTLFSDVCLCPYTTHGHCGVVRGPDLDNDATLPLLAEQAVAFAQAGADFVAPSDMMDGRVAALRQALDRAGFAARGILAYTAKYASSYYGPFREALESAPQEGPRDRATYQMDARNRREALRELALDVAEGADMVMVKPALAYLDIIAAFRDASPVPVVAYSVSGEYALVETLAKAGLADRAKLALENLTAIRRAGADAIITYFASEAAEKGWVR